MPDRSRQKQITPRLLAGLCLPRVGLESVAVSIVAASIRVPGYIALSAARNQLFIPKSLILGWKPANRQPSDGKLGPLTPVGDTVKAHQWSILLVDEK